MDFFVFSSGGFLVLVDADMDLVEDEEATEVLLELELMDAFDSLELDAIEDADMLDSLSAVEVGELWFERLAKVDLTGIRGAWFMSNRGLCRWRLMPELESAFLFTMVSLDCNLLLFVTELFMIDYCCKKKKKEKKNTLYKKEHILVPVNGW